MQSEEERKKNKTKYSKKSMQIFTIRRDRNQIPKNEGKTYTKETQMNTQQLLCTLRLKFVATQVALFELKITWA